MKKRGQGKARGRSAGEEPERGNSAAEERIPWIRKRDGRRVPFDPDKIRLAIAKAMEAVGDRDASFASEVASVVELTLIERRRQALSAGGVLPEFASAGDPHIEEIQDLVERALMELGRPRVAKAYILYRDGRKRAREAVRVHHGDSKTSLRVRDRGGSGPWNKGHILASLVQEAELPEKTAEEVAAAVERRVFASGLRRVSTALVRELVAGELVQRGLTRAWKRHGAVGLPRREVRRVLRETPRRPWETPGAGDPAQWLGAEILERFVTDDVLSEGSAELHRSGDLSIIGLGRLPAPLSLVLDAELLAGSAREGRPARVLQGAARLAAEVSRVVVLERPYRALAPLATGVGPFSEWLLALDAVGRAARTRIELGTSGVGELDFTRTLLQGLDALDEAARVGAYVDGHELEELLSGASGLEDCVERSLDSGKLRVVWNSGDDTFAGPGCLRRGGEPGALSCAGAVALNLPRLARRAGPWNEEILFNGVAELVQAALEIARDLKRFQDNETESLPRGIVTRASFGLVPVGLHEALRILGDGAIDLEKGARLLGLLSEAAQRFAVEEAPRILPTPFFGGEAARRFAWMDRMGPRSDGAERQGRLFAEVPDEELSRPYTTGYSVSPASGWPAGRAEARCLRNLTSGVLYPVPRSQAVRDVDHPCLAGWRRFELFRRAHAGEVSLELFPSDPAGHVLKPQPARAARPRYPLRPLA